jgi:hypothetical protein
VKIEIRHAKPKWVTADAVFSYQARHMNFNFRYRQWWIYIFPYAAVIVYRFLEPTRHRHKLLVHGLIMMEHYFSYETL